MVTKQVPWPGDSGGRIRDAHVAELYAGLVDEVHVLAFGEPPPAGEAVPDRVRVHAFAGAQLLQGAARSRSSAVGRWYSRALRDRLAGLLRPEDHLHVGFSQMVVNAPSPARVDSLDLHNVEGDLFRQRARAYPVKALRPLLAVEAGRLRAWERRVSQGPFVSCVSPQDRERLRALGVQAVVAANGTTPPGVVAPQPTGESVVFVSSLDWQPNAEGARWLCEQVWPRVSRARPAATLALVGRSPGPEVRALAGPGVSVQGDVPSVAPAYAAARLAVCPLLTGGGSRLKIVEALAHGRPVVSTTLGAEGLESLTGRGVVLADSPQALATTVADLLADPDRCAELGRLGRAAVQADWTWPRVLAPIAAGLRADAP